MHLSPAVLYLVPNFLCNGKILFCVSLREYQQSSNILSFYGKTRDRSSFLSATDWGLFNFWEHEETITIIIVLGIRCTLGRGYRAWVHPPWSACWVCLPACLGPSLRRPRPKSQPSCQTWRRHARRDHRSVIDTFWHILQEKLKHVNFTHCTVLCNWVSKDRFLDGVGLA